MADYKRFIAYIYEYTDGRKNKNTGFAKIESRNGICRIQIHLQNIPQEEGPRNIYGFVREGEWLLGIFLGKMGEGQTEIRLTTHSEHIGNSRYSLELLAGLWLEGRNEKKFLTLFDEEAVDVHQLVTELPKQEEDLHREEPEIEESPKQEPEIEESPKQEPEIEEPPKQEPEIEEPPKQEPEIEEPPKPAQAQSCPQSEQGCQRPLTCPAGAGQRWECMSRRYPHMAPFAEEKGMECLRISPRDLGALRQGNWPMGNNSFLMHGYYNFRHLLFAREKDGTYLLGIPGFYENQEFFMANMFGFPDFLEAEQQEEGRTFGYWCRRI